MNINEENLLKDILFKVTRLEVTDDQLDLYHQKVVEKYKARELAVCM